MGFTDNNPVNKWDVLGRETSGKQKCQQMVNNALAKQSELIDLLKKHDCKIPKVKCKCCGDADLGGYYRPKFLFWGNTITMCQNNLGDDQSVYDTILKHEMFHAVQSCYKEKEDGGCRTSVCKEIEAYYNSNCAHLADPEDRKACVKQGVDYSSANFCKKWFGLGSVDQERIDKYFSELYDKCKTRSR